MNKKLIGLLTSTLVLIGAVGCGAKPVTNYTVTFMNEDKVFATQTVAENKLAEKPTTNPTKDQTAIYVYTFQCWALNDVEYNFSTPVTGDLTLKAKYKEEYRKYTVTFDYNDNGQTQKVSTQQNAESFVTLPTAPKGYEKEGYKYTFECWKDDKDNVLVEGTTKVTGDVNYTAHYTSEVITYRATVVYSYDDFKADDVIEYDTTNRTAKLKEVSDLLPTTPEGEYSWKEPLPSELPFEDKTYTIQSESVFATDYKKKGATAETSYVVKTDGEGHSVKIDEDGKGLNVKYGGSSKDYGITTVNDYSNFTLSLKMKITPITPGQETFRIGFKFGFIGNDDPCTLFDTSENWVRIDSNGNSAKGSGNGTYITYADHGATFNVGDFNIYTFQFSTPDEYPRVAFSMNNVKVATFVLSDAQVGKIMIGFHDGKTHTQTFEYISVAL